VGSGFWRDSDVRHRIMEKRSEIYDLTHNELCEGNKKALWDLFKVAKGHNWDQRMGGIEPLGFTGVKPLFLDFSLFFSFNRE
jgi:hypothetical protein